MPQLLLEFFSEEIPARMQKRAEEDLARALGEKLKAAGFDAKAIKTFSTPRRIGAMIEDLPAKAADVNEEKKGPRVGALDTALQGFLKSAGLTSIEQAQIVEDKKGAFYVARIERAGRETSDILQDIVPEIVRAFPWPKSMRSGASDLQWVRPLQNILCLFAGAPVKISVDGVASEAKTWGHRFHAPDAIRPKDFADYAARLRAAKVLIDREERKAIILKEAQAACAKRGLELVPDPGLLEEVAGLVEWPVVLLGDMDAGFLDLPGEVIRLSMRTHQKYFAVRDPKTQKLAPHFVVVANVEAKDGGKAIAAGNARVLSARLNDARFFWDSDRKTPLYTEERRAKLEKIVFHQKLGSVWDKVERVKALAVELCAVTGADRALVERAALLCKMDLVTESVGEFPELQGQVGRQLYLSELSGPLLPRGEGAGDEGRSNKQASDRRLAPHPPTPSPQGRGGGESIAAAIEDHYRPLGPGDRVPSDPVAITLALADKLDTLVGFWAIDEKPTGSSDPYALRRAALGLVRIVLENGIRLSLVAQIATSYRATADHYFRSGNLFVAQRDEEEDGRRFVRVIEVGQDWPRDLAKPFDSILVLRVKDPKTFAIERRFEAKDKEFVGVVWALWQVSHGVRHFLADRLKVQLREQGKRHDLVDAVFALGDDDLVRIVARVEALDAFLKTEAGANLLAGYKRAANILSAEEKKGKWSADEAQGAVDAAKLAEPAEKALHAALEAALPAARANVEKEDFAAAMKALASLRAPVDAFFESVLVNAEDAALRRNRLLLLARFREALSAVADFSKVEG
ncbi:MAG: glycine--tRNA ligase subunit beta [Hyphomonadaceae bacterium]|nr:glycine--tRNA ligase subunit beta [Hyphomonadaceae bacterium]